MSTRASLFYSDSTDSHIYEETSEPQSFWGRFQGNNIYACIEQLDLLSFRVEGDFFTVKFNAGSELVKTMGVTEWRIFGADIVSVEYDADGLVVVIKGGSTLAKKLSSKTLLE